MLEFRDAVPSLKGPLFLPTIIQLLIFNWVILQYHQHNLVLTNSYHLLLFLKLEFVSFLFTCLFSTEGQLAEG